MKILLFLIVVIMMSCTSSNKKIVFTNSSDKYYVKFERSGNLTNDTICIFYDYNNPSLVKQTGFYKNGLQNDKWVYNLSDEVKTLEWGMYEDENLNFKTNLFSYADSIKHYPSNTKFLFKMDREDIILSLSINGPLKDSLPDLNYERITKNELIANGLTPLEFSIKILTNNREIHLAEAKLQSSSDGEVRYVIGAFGFINKKTFVEFSVSSSNKPNFYSKALFDAVLTNLYIKGVRFYNPFASQ